MQTCREELEERLEYLKPYVAEARRIQRFLQMLDDPEVDEAAFSTRVYQRRFPTEARLQQVWGLVRRSPGIRRKDVALAMGISQARAGQLVNELIIAGRLVDDGRGHLTVAEEVER